MIARRLLTTLTGFRNNRDGQSGIEFALIVPFLILLLAGSVDLTRAIDDYRKVTLLTRTIADLTGQGDMVSPISSATMTDIVSSSKLVLTPFASNPTTIVVSALGVYLTTGTKPYVCSSYASNATARKVSATASDLTVPAQYLLAGKRYLLAEVTSTYTSIFSTFLTSVGLPSSYSFKVTLAWPPRNGLALNSTYAEIILPNGAACPLLAL